MKPLKLTIQAFGSYGEKTVIDFSKPSQNLFLITGDTGAGKTTIFDAIVFALYGEASSGSNKKDGVELQSQFVNYGITPFVELTFSELVGGEDKQYTVHRVPQHMRPLKRGTGETHETEKVSLTMPDGLEYSQNQKETDKKIEEIVGLTKGQFMQVAMIAQGEFMELLRAKSDDKKVVFRKLFNTGLFQTIVEELGNRRKEKSTEIAQIRTVCQQEVSHIVIPETYENRDKLQEIKAEICTATRLNVTELEQLISELKKLCEKLETERDAAASIYTEASRIRDEKRDSYTKAKTLVGAFAQLEKAQQELTECQAAEASIQETIRLIGDIHTGYEIQALYEKYKEAAKILAETEQKLTEQKELLPALCTSLEDALKEESEAKMAQDAELERFSKVEDRVKKAVDIFAKIKKAKLDVEKKHTALTAAEKKEAKAKQKMEEVFADIASAVEHLEPIAEKKAKVTNALQAYEDAKAAYNSKKEEYDRKSSAFLDAQAGLIAKTLLQGKPCPVCGSIEHPSPAVLVDGQEHLTREMIDALSAEVSRLDQDRSDKSTTANEEAALLEEQKVQFAETIKTELRDTYEEAVHRTHEARTAWATSQETLKGLESQNEYANNTEAESALAAATKAKEEKVAVYNGAHKAAQSAKTAKETAETLIQEFETSLPEQREKQTVTKSAYEDILKQKDMAESEWQAIVNTHAKAEVTALQQKVEAHNTKKATAEGGKKSALETIGSQTKPDMEALSLAKTEAESRLLEVQHTLDQLKEDYKTNTSVYEALAPKMEQRSRATQEYTRIDSLYNRLAGKVTGARMDIETFVLRYYLQRILHAANARFQDMSAGQFELRMVGEEQAGEGKNRGLDLMVYSTVTGKEREVRTLSGGESFMAALSLALGMADTIQENSSAINLDVMFIDEGFGSLDDHSRDQAVKVLQRMASGQKLIGIISHVTELKQKIDDQLVVKKDEKGSHVKWEIG